MIIYFISALLICAALFKLGCYWTIVNLMAISGKAVAALLLVAGPVLLYRHYKQSRRTLKLPARPDK